jgi:hypothetical protein
MEQSVEVRRGTSPTLRSARTRNTPRHDCPCGLGDGCHRYLVEFAFGGLGLVPDQADARIPDDRITWNRTTWLDIVFLLLAASLLVRFLRTGGPAMLWMMGGSPDHTEHEDHDSRMHN